MNLTREEKSMLDGMYGPGIQKCMSLLVKWGEIFDAESMVNVNHVHFSLSIPDKLLEEMSEGVERVRSLASIHAAFDPQWFVGRFYTVLKNDLARGSVIDDDLEFVERIKRLNNLSFFSTQKIESTPFKQITKGGKYVYANRKGSKAQSHSTNSRAGES